jgi:hypothetical protein
MSSWGRAQGFSKHVEDIIEEIVRQVGYLPESYEDARSEKYKKLRDVFWGGYHLFSRDSN